MLQSIEEATLIGQALETLLLFLPIHLDTIMTELVAQCQPNILARSTGCVPWYVNNIPQ